jgi:hypothetical protein
LKKLILVILSSLSLQVWAQPEDPDARQKGFTDLQNSGKLISMVIEPKGNQLRIYLTGKKAAAIKMENAKVEASYFIGGQKKSLTVQRQVDPQSKRSYYVIDKFEPAMKNLKINVTTDKHSESFDLPDMQ